MSADFEKIVLEKLNILDELKTEVKNLSKKVHNLDTKVNNLEEKVDKNTNSINNLSSKVNNLSDRVYQLEEKVGNNTNSINNLSKKIDINTDLIATLSKQVEQQGLNLASFEHEFTVKVQALFDSFVANTENHLSYEKSIAVLHAKTFDQNNRISVLEDYYKDTKLLATN